MWNSLYSAEHEDQTTYFCTSFTRRAPGRISELQRVILVGAWGPPLRAHAFICLSSTVPTCFPCAPFFEANAICNASISGAVIHVQLCIWQICCPHLPHLTRFLQSGSKSSNFYLFVINGAYMLSMGSCEANTNCNATRCPASLIYQ